MGAKFPFSMENIPRQKRFGCFSLKIGSVFSALVIIIYSVMAIAQCLAILNVLPSNLSQDESEIIASYGVIILITVIHVTTFVITSLMLVGVLREKANLIRPWLVWTTVQVMTSVLMFIFWSTLNVIIHSGDNSLILYVLEFLGLTLRFYMLMLVASYYKQLEDEKDETERLRNIINHDMWYSAA
ncbi:PREDICTED: uncharacterized protein LOC106113669 [Papilio xuthus]|uniref:Uncharacterized protein LOC106113669 n=1 Tax=Papilio xuthus TaxID=66420 RepID=A0A194PCL3_PAPXU|nr:PREDICTED: uncharacterized protein LOC106113669 [Papilio xuthus]KPI90942.1 hypothetical protein RR46_14446 [Papilio xuthus]